MWVLLLFYTTIFYNMDVEIHSRYISAQSCKEQQAKSVNATSHLMKSKAVNWEMMCVKVSEEKWMNKEID